MPATWDPNVFTQYSITVAASAPITLTPIPTGQDYALSSVLGAWSKASKTAGGCPNFPDSWTQNPQITLTTAVGGARLGENPPALGPWWPSCSPALGLVWPSCSPALCLV